MSRKPFMAPGGNVTAAEAEMNAHPRGVLCVAAHNQQALINWPRPAEQNQKSSIS
jgi:hypothetical protein